MGGFIYVSSEKVKFMRRRQREKHCERKTDQRATQAADVDVAQGVGKEVGETNLDSTGLHKAFD